MTGLQYFYGIAAAAFVVTSLVIATVRWFHMCRPYDRNPKYFYPGRKATTIIYLSAIIVIPYIVLPENTGAWLLVKAYFLPAELYFLGVLLFSYFGSVMHWRRWRKPTLLLGLAALLALLSGPAASLLGGGSNFVGYQLGCWIIYGLGVFMTGFCILAMYVVLRWVRRIDVENYSNMEDFPVAFARKIIRLIVVTMVLLWITAISDSREVMAASHILLSLGSVLMLVWALHPHRHRDPEDEPAPTTAKPLSASRTKALAASIRRVVEEEEAFLDPHLTLQDVASRCGTSRTYIANVFKTEFGSFFSYVNTLRLNYADKYREAHPKASVAEIAAESGFGTRQTYYNVKAKLQ